MSSKQFRHGQSAATSADRRTISLRQAIRNRLVILLNRVGLPVGPMHLLTIPGRRSGLPRTTPVAPIVVNGERYIVQAYPNSDWVKNARAAGHGLLTRGRHTRQVALVEVDTHQRGTILREFPAQNPRGVGAFLRNGLVDSRSSDSFAAAAASCPVFHVVPREKPYPDAVQPNQYAAQVNLPTPVTAESHRCLRP